LGVSTLGRAVSKDTLLLGELLALLLLFVSIDPLLFLVENSGNPSSFYLPASVRLTLGLLREDALELSML